MLCEEGGKEPASHLLPLLPHRHRAGASRHLAGWRPETPAVQPAWLSVSAAARGGPELAESEGTHVKKHIAKSRVTTADLRTVRQHGA